MFFLIRAVRLSEPRIRCRFTSSGFYLRMLAIVAMMAAKEPTEVAMLSVSWMEVWVMGFEGTTISQPGIGLAFLGLRAETARLADVVAGALALLIHHGVGIEHLAVHFHGAGVGRHHDAVALAQHNVFVAAGV